MKTNRTQNTNLKKKKNETTIINVIGKKKRKKIKVDRTNNKSNVTVKEKKNFSKQIKDKTQNKDIQNEANIINDERFTFNDELWKKYEKEESKKGIIYLSNVPLGMSISKIKEIFGEYGQIENIHLNKMKKKRIELDIISKEKSEKIKKFEDGFIEYSNKQDAIRVEKLLNNKFVGGKKRKNIARDYFWHVKYIKGLTWNNLTEPILQRNMEKQEVFKFAIKQMRKDYSCYIENKTEESNTKQKLKSEKNSKMKSVNDDYDNNHNYDRNEKTQQNKRFKFENNNSNKIINDKIITDSFEKKKKIVSEKNQKNIWKHIPNKKLTKQKGKIKPISTDLAKLLF